MLRTALISLLFVAAARACGPTHPGSTPGGGSAADGGLTNGNTCQTPDGFAALTTGDITLSDRVVTRQPQFNCTSCTSGVRRFHSPATGDDPQGAVDDSQATVAAQCPNAPFCVCLADGTCCSVGATAPTEIWMIPFCTDAGVCTTEAVLQGDDAASLTCGGTTYTVSAQFDANGDYLPLGQGNYIIADYVSCTNNCVAPTCQGPVV